MAPQKQKTTKNKPGARRKGLDVTYQLRFTLADRKAWEDLAEKAGMELSQWIRLQCARAANANVQVVGVEFKTEYHDAPVVPS